MSRVDEMEEAIKNYWNECIEAREAELCKHEDKLEKEFRQNLIILKDEQIKKQVDGKQKEIRYLYLCRLNSSVYTQSYELILGMSSARLFMDEHKSMIYFCPYIIYESIDEDMEEVKKRLGKQFIRLQDYELLCLKLRLLDKNWNLTKKYYQRMIEKSQDIIIAGPLRTERELLILCGDYMDEMPVIKCIENEREK